MPIYEYVCRSCGRELEKLQKMSDAVLTDCPECGEAALKRKVSAAAFRLAGSGWYETDFKSGNRQNIAGDGGKPEASGDASGKASGDASGDASGKATGNGSGAATTGKDGGNKAGKDTSTAGSKGAATP